MVLHLRLLLMRPVVACGRLIRVPVKVISPILLRSQIGRLLFLVEAFAGLSQFLDVLIDVVLVIIVTRAAHKVVLLAMEMLLEMRRRVVE